MTRKTLAIYAAAALSCAALLAAASTAARAGTVTIETVPVGDVGNLSDPLTGYGAVPYPYSIGKYDVTMGQYAAFLNSVATSGDPYGLYSTSMATATPTYSITQTSTSAGLVYAAKGNSANVPVTYVSWGDAARFVNWLANGEPNGPEGPGTTETGTYALNGSTGSAALMAVTRSSTATWVLPTVDEWYKSAYYTGGGTNAGYWDYPTANNTPPINTLSATGTNNANFQDAASGLLTPVGFFTGSPGPYGTFDQGGDVWQWNETAQFGTSRGIRGGSYAGSVSTLFRYTDNGTTPTGAYVDVGFRVASVPEPNALSLSICFAMSIFMVSILRLQRRGGGAASRLLRWWLAQRGRARSRTKTTVVLCRRRPQTSAGRLLQFERLEEKQLLSANLYWDGASNASWLSQNWLATPSSTTTTNWSDGDIANFQETSLTVGGSIAVTIPAGSTVTPAAVNFTFNVTYTISGGAVSLSSSTTVDVDVPSNVVSVVIASPIIGAGKLAKVDASQLQIASAANSYSGGTDIENGTLQLEKDATLNAPAPLGSGGLLMGASSTFDMNGCSVTLPKLSDDYAPDSGSTTERIIDTSNTRGTSGSDFDYQF